MVQGKHNVQILQACNSEIRQKCFRVKAGYLFLLCSPEDRFGPPLNFEVLNLKHLRPWVIGTTGNYAYGDGVHDLPVIVLSQIR